MDQLKLGQMTLTWLDGGVTAIDGGAIFGVVPRALWSKRYPVNEENKVEMPTDPILIQYMGKNYLIDSSVGNGKLNEKQKRNFGVWAEASLEKSLAELGLTPSDIDYVLMTHMHFDHIGGLTMPNENGELISRFKNAKILVSSVEWEETRNPNIRSKSTYFKENWEAIVDQVETFDDEVEVVEGIRMIHTGGHSNGHSIIMLNQGDQQVIHMGDLMAMHAHQNPLWVMAYDDYPMDSIAAKVKVFEDAYEKGTMFTFYHDAYYRMVVWDKEGKEIVNKLPRTIKPFVPWFELSR